MVWEAAIRPAGRAKITEDDNLGFRRLARRFVVEGPRVTAGGLDKSVDSITISTPGTGFAVNDALVFSGGELTSSRPESVQQATGKVSAVDGAGAITAVTITSAGSGYYSTPTVAITTSGGANGVLLAGMTQELFLPAGTPDEEFPDFYLVHQYTEASASMEKTILTREYAQLRNTWAKESIVETGELKKLSRSYAVIRQDNVVLASLGAPALGYDPAELALMPKYGQQAHDGNDPWDMLPEIIKDTEPTNVSYEDQVPSSVTSPTTTASTTLRTVWARHVEVVEEGTGTDAGNFKLEIVGATPYSMGTQPVSGIVTYLEENTNVTMEVGAKFAIIVDPRVPLTKDADSASSYNITDKPLYSTSAEGGDKSSNNELNNLDVGATTVAFLKPDTLTPVMSIFAGSKALIGDSQAFDLSSAEFPTGVAYLESFVNIALAAASLRWIRASATLDTSNPGVDLWTVSWAAPISPYWRSGGSKAARKGVSEVYFDHNGLTVQTPTESTGGGTSTFTWFNVGEQVAFEVQNQVREVPFVSLDFFIMGTAGNSRTLTFKQTFANAVFPLANNTNAFMRFPTLADFTGADPTTRANLKGGMSGAIVARKKHGGFIFTYSEPDTGALINRPIYQNSPIQRAGGKITWTHRYDPGGSFPVQFKVTPIYSHNKDRIWKIEATFS